MSGPDQRVLLTQRLNTAKNRLNETVAEYERQKDVISKYPDNFAMKLALNSVEHRRRELENIISVTQDELSVVLSNSIEAIMDLSLYGPSYINHTADVYNFSEVMSYLQRFFTSILQSVSVGPTARGQVAQAVTNMSRLRMVSTYPSSFGIKLSLENDDGLFKEFNVQNSALEALFSVLNNSSNNEQLITLLGELGPRSISHFRRFINALAKTDTSIKLFLSDSDGVKSWNANSQEIQVIRSKIMNVRLRENFERAYIGEMHTASLTRGTFELLTQEGLSIRGRFVGSALEDVRLCFGKSCLINVTESVLYDETTDKDKTSYTLQSAQILA